MSKGAKPPAAPIVQQQTPVPTEDTAAVEEARRKELQVAAKAQGRAATLLADQKTIGTAPTQRKTLLGQ